MADILRQAQAQNRRDNVTGCLGFSETHFAQVLEGLPNTVDRTFMKIRRDPRHRDVEIMLTRPIRNRSFPDWDMTSFRLDPGHERTLVSSFLPNEEFSVLTTPPSQLLMVLIALGDHQRLSR